MLTAVPRSWFTWEFSLLDQGTRVAELDMATFGEHGSISIGERVFEIRRQGVASGAFELTRNGTVLASATKPSAFVRSFEIESEGESYTLRAASLFTRALVLSGPSSTLGSIRPASVLSRRADVDLPAELPLVFRAFVAWLTLLLWRRQAATD